MLLDEPDWIRYNSRCHEAFGLLAAFIDSASGDAASVQELVQATIVTLRDLGNQEPTKDQYTDESRVLFATIFSIVKELDAEAAQHDFLIKLLLSIRAIPLPPSVLNEIDPYDLDSNMNQDLYHFMGVLADFEDDAPLHPRLEDRPGSDNGFTDRPPWRQEPHRYLTAGEWTTISAFLARLHAAAPNLIDLDLRGLWAMIEGLEQTLSPSRLEDVLPAAACWVFYAGEELKVNDVDYADYYDDDGSLRLPWSRGPLWTGQKAFSLARWNFWMRRFKVISERENVSDAVRAYARRAFDFGCQ